MRQTLESAFYKMVLGHKIKEKIDINKFLEQIQEYKKEEISITKHTLFRLNEKQKKAYDEEFIRELLFNETPFLMRLLFWQGYNTIIFGLFSTNMKKKFLG